MSFVFNEAEFKKESEEFYSTYPADVSEIENELSFLFGGHYRKGQKFSCRGISSNTGTWLLGAQNALSGKGI